MDMTLFFFTLPQISEPLFFSPIFSNAIATIVMKKFPPYFSNGIATISFSKFFFPISAMSLPQLVCHNFSPLFWQYHCHSHNQFVTNFFFPYFGNGIATIFFSPISVMVLPQTNCKIFFNDTCTQFLQQILSVRLILLD